MASETTNQTPAVKRSQRRQGFLPINTNTFDRVFISIVLFVAINLLWMRFLEQTFPLALASVVSLILAFLILRYG